MKVSLSVVKQYIDFELPPVDELVARINQQLGGVEDVINLAAKYKDAVIVRVVEAEQHPNADRLKVTKIDDGGVVTDVPRDENGLVQVVCGAPNARGGIFAVWLPPGSTVPASFDEPEPFVLDARELRGVVSQGMLAAADELAIGTDHDGIMEIEEYDLPSLQGQPLKPLIGKNFAEVFGLDDYVIDIENKMFTHRPDLFGQLGVAREIAGILGHTFTSPKWYLGTPAFETGAGLELTAFNDAPECAPRFMAVALKDVEVKPSPLWLQCALVAMGGKPINNIVDVTNYVMLLTAQPTHAYDYDKIRGHTLGVRMARDGEKAELLNGKTYELTSDDIVIADGEGVVGLAGIMGGGNSEVSDSTKNVVLEVANFDMYAVRKSSMRHGVFTDALTRFNKGQSPFQNDYILGLLMTMMKDMASAEQASDVFDIGTYNDDCIFVLTDDDRFGGRPHMLSPHGITEQFINERLGLKLTTPDIITLLENVEFVVKRDENGLDIYEPFWRTDIEEPEDIVEEVGRLYGFDKLPRELPVRSIIPAELNKAFEAKRRIRHALARLGANEVLTYSFVHENLIKRAEQDVNEAFRLSNALSPDLQYYRLSLTPSLLAHVHPNIKAGHDEFLIFEIGKAHGKSEMDEDGLPKEFGRIAGVYAAGKKSATSRDGSPYFVAKRYVRELCTGRDLTYTPLKDAGYADHTLFRQMCAPYDENRSAVIRDGDRLVGVVGEFKPSVARAFKLQDYSAGFELFLSAFEGESGVNYRPLSRFPSVSQDISLKVAAGVPFEHVASLVQQVIAAQGSEYTIDSEPISIYQADDDAQHQTMTFRLRVTNYDRTLTDENVTKIMDALADLAAQKIDAVRV